MKSYSPVLTTLIVTIVSFFRLLPPTHHHLLRRVSAFIPHVSVKPSYYCNRYSTRSCSGSSISPLLTTTTTTRIKQSTQLHDDDAAEHTTSPPTQHTKLITTRCKMPFTYTILSEQNATTTNAIIEHYSTNTQFLHLAKSEGEGILQRDAEDASKLQKGIDIAKSKGVLDPNFVPEEYISVDVMGKNPEVVADEILDIVRKGGSSDDNEGKGGAGGVVVLCGLSGTGKVSIAV